MASKSSKLNAYIVTREYLLEQLGEPFARDDWSYRKSKALIWQIQCKMATIKLRLEQYALEVYAAGTQVFHINEASVKWDFGGDELLLADPNFFYKLSYDIARAMACASAGMYTHSCIGWMAQNNIEPHLNEYIKKWKGQ